MKESDKSIVFVIGNSINRLNSKGTNHSWEDIIKKWEIKFGINTEEKWLDELTLSQRATRLMNGWSETMGEKNSDEEDAIKEYNSFCSDLCNLARNEYHDKLEKSISKFLSCEIMTTNYDYTLEGGIHEVSNPNNETREKFEAKKEIELLENIKRKCDNKIWHIHGEAAVPASIVMDVDSYVRSLTALKIYGNYSGTWLHKFIHSTVYIIGIDLDHHEMLLMYAIQEKMRQNTIKEKPVKYYRFLSREQEQKDSFHAQKEYLRSFGVEIEDIEIKKSYEDAWDEVLKKIEKIQFETKNKRTVFRKRWYGSNISVSSSPTFYDDKRCWINISVEKLNKACDKQLNWIFDFLVDDERYTYVILSNELRKTFDNNAIQPMNNEPMRYSFYIEYESGDLYKTLQAKDSLMQLKHTEFELIKHDIIRLD